MASNPETKNAPSRIQRLPIDIMTTSPALDFQYAGDDDVRFETSNDEGDKSISTTRSGKKRKRHHGSQTPAESVSRRQLPCPYLKRDPHTHGQKTSCLKAYETIHRLKEHLYRTHQQKPHCSRCRKTFDEDEDVAQHQRLQFSCELNKAVPVEGFNGSQLKKLKDKKYPPEVKSEEDKWRHVYGILFPNSDEIPDPSYQLFIDGVACRSCSALTTQRETWLQFTQGVPSHLEATICELVEKALQKTFSSLERRRVEESLKGLDVLMSRQPREMVAAAEAGEASKAELPQVEAIGHSGSSACHPYGVLQPVVNPGIHILNAALQDSLDAAAPVVEAPQSSFDANVGINFDCWNQPASYWTSLDCMNDGHHITGSSLEGHSGSSHRSFGNFGAQTHDGFNTESSNSADAVSFMDSGLFGGLLPTNNLNV